MMLSVVLFGIAALGGVVLAIRRFQGLSFPMPLSIVHGLVAAVALVNLIIQVFGQDEIPQLLLVSLILFIITALGGFLAFSYHLRGKVLPIPLMLVHGAAAVIAYVLLLLNVL